jgi:Holliday junction resolvase RusA-like endonuclease
MTIHLPHNPSTATAQGKRAARTPMGIRFYKSADMKKAEASLEALLIPHRPETPVASPCKLEIEYVFPWRKTEPKKRLALGKVPHTTRPDCSNLVKAIEDLLCVHRFIRDDAGIAELVVKKSWGENPGITITIEPMEAA